MSNVQESLLQAAIPGQSLTDEPKNFPWERAAEYSDPTEAARYELKKLNKPEVLDSVLALLQTGFPIIPLAETIKTNSQAEGLYNPDIGLLIAPVIIQQLVSTAEDAGLDYVMGDEVDEEEMSDKEDERVDAMLRKKITKLLTKDPKDEIVSDALDFLKDEPSSDIADNIEEAEMMDTQEEQEGVEIEEPKEEKPMGLMSRSTM
jgi:hypothetical protein|tara:strand:+ start:266 stop:877 length:612 start_codon:yes stop_codon:yes gene_type:complete